MTERYCLPWEHTDWGRDEQVYRCAECGTRVIFNAVASEHLPRLVCSACLSAASVPSASLEDRLQPHPFVHGEHCADCLTFGPRLKSDPKPWDGSM